jgi:hypothetical protein
LQHRSITENFLKGLPSRGSISTGSLSLQSSTEFAKIAEEKPKPSTISKFFGRDWKSQKPSLPFHASLTDMSASPKVMSIPVRSNKVSMITSIDSDITVEELITRLRKKFPGNTENYVLYPLLLERAY